MDDQSTSLVQTKEEQQQTHGFSSGPTGTLHIRMNPNSIGDLLANKMSVCVNLEFII